MRHRRQDPDRPVLSRKKWTVDPDTGVRVYGNPIWGDLRLTQPELFADIAENEHRKRLGKVWNGYRWERADGSCQYLYGYSQGERLDGAEFDDQGESPLPVRQDDPDWGM